MRLLLAIAAVLMLSSLGLAAHETSQLGPYNVSFDMNTSLKYQVQHASPMNLTGGTIYNMLVTTNNATRAQITITENKNLTDSTIALYGQLSKMYLNLIGFNTTSPMEIAIDGKKGFILGATPIPENKELPQGTNLIKADYWLDSKNCECGPVSVGTTSVDITSTYPQNVTQGLLNSLHVVKVPAK